MNEKSRISKDNVVVFPTLQTAEARLANQEMRDDVESSIALFAKDIPADKKGNFEASLTRILYAYSVFNVAELFSADAWLPVARVESGVDTDLTTVKIVCGGLASHLRFIRERVSTAHYENEAYSKATYWEMVHTLAALLKNEALSGVVQEELTYEKQSALTGLPHDYVANAQTRLNAVLAQFNQLPPSS